MSPSIYPSIRGSASQNKQSPFDRSSDRVFPKCVARVPVHSGGLGAESVFARRRVSVRNRSQNRSCDPRMAVPMVSSAGGVIFGGFQRFVASFRVVGVALCDIQTCFVTCRKSFCVAGAILFATFSEDA